MIKKFGALLLFLVFIANFCSCHMEPYYVQGLENYIDVGFEYGITNDLLCDDMLDAYEYTNGDYFVYMDLHGEDVVKSYAYLEYSNDVYENAKSFMLTRTEYVERAVYDANGYVFYQNLSRGKAYTQSETYFENAAWIGFNDSKQTLYFLVMHVGHKKEEALNIYNQKGFEGFLQQFYGEYYDFGI